MYRNNFRVFRGPELSMPTGSHHYNDLRISKSQELTGVIADADCPKWINGTLPTGKFCPPFGQYTQLGRCGTQGSLLEINADPLRQTPPDDNVRITVEEAVLDLCRRRSAAASQNDDVSEQNLVATATASVGQQPIHCLSRSTDHPEVERVPRFVEEQRSYQPAETSSAQQLLRLCVVERMGNQKPGKEDEGRACVSHSHELLHSVRARQGGHHPNGSG